MNRKHQDKYEKLGLNVAYYRKLKKMTQLDLAERVNISRTHVSRIEMCVCAVSLDVIFDIAEALDIPPYKLLEFRD